MQQILVPFDGSASAKRALQYVADTYKGNTAVQVHVLNIQENMIYFDGYLDASTMQEVERSITATGEKIVLEAAEVLQRNSIPHQLHVQLGLVAENIARQAEVLGCDSLVMGTRGLGSLSGLVLGSVATKVVHLVHVPVTLVK